MNSTIIFIAGLILGGLIGAILEGLWVINLLRKSKSIKYKGGQKQCHQ